jgi:hypothetical protein
MLLLSPLEEKPLQPQELILKLLPADGKLGTELLGSRFSYKKRMMAQKALALAKLPKLTVMSCKELMSYSIYRLGGPLPLSPLTEVAGYAASTPLLCLVRRDTVALPGWLLSPCERLAAQ